MGCEESGGVEKLEPDWLPECHHDSSLDEEVHERNKDNCVPDQQLPDARVDAFLISVQDSCDKVEQISGRSGLPLVFHLAQEIGVVLVEPYQFFGVRFEEDVVVADEVGGGEDEADHPSYKFWNIYRHLMLYCLS